MYKKKFFITTTVPMTLSFFKGQCQLLKEYYDVCAISSPDKELIPFVEQEGIRYKGLRMKREISLLNDILSLIRWIWLLSCERPYIVHANTPKASLLAMVASWLTFRPIRIYMCHGLRYQGCTGLKRKILIAMEKVTCFCANQVICVSKGVQMQFAEDDICSLKKSRVILYGSANGVDTNYFDYAKVDETAIKLKYNLTNDDFTCLFIGRMVRDKGIEELVEATKKLHDEGFPIKLLFIGGRETRLDSLSKETEETLSQNDYFIECGRQSDVRPFIKASNILVLPSYREGFGQVLVEANSMGVPVIASNIIGCNNVVVEGVNGILCEPKNIKSLHEAMKTLLKEEKLYNRIKECCRSYTVTHYDRKIVAKAYVDYYYSLLK